MKSSSSAYTMKEQHALAEHRDIASFNADNEFNGATDEENIDFNIPGVPNSTVKRSHGVNVHNLIQKIKNHPQRQAFQSDLQQHRPFNPLSKESQDVIKAAGNTELCEMLDVEPKAQCKACLAYWGAGIVYSTCGHFLRDDTTENKKYIKLALDLFRFPTTTSGKVDPTVTATGRKFVYSGEKWKTRTKSRSEMPVWTVSQRFSHFQWRRLFKRIMGQTNCRFLISTLTSSLHQQSLLAGK